MLEGMRPDALLLNIAMPDMDGFQIAAELRERPELRAAPAHYFDRIRGRRDAAEN
jgi:CheY-like chemotaxis protein